MKWLFAAGLMLALGLTGCENTVHGFGKDMQKAGEKIQSSADDSGANSGK